MLSNPGFEEGFNAKGEAKDWFDNTSWAPVKVKVSPDSDNPHSGKYSQKIECSKFDGGGVLFRQPLKNIELGKTYEISAWMKGDCLSPVRLLVRQTNMPYKALLDKSFKISNEWQRYKFIATVLLKESNPCVFLVQYASVGTLYVDDVSLREIKQQENVYKNQGNLLDNGSFELGLANWGFLSREYGSYVNSPAIELADMRAVPDKDCVDGKYSLKVVNPANGHARFTSKAFKVNSGREYSLSVWMKSDKPGQKVSLAFGSGYVPRNTEFAQNFNLTNSWARYSITRKLPMAEDDLYFAAIYSFDPGTFLVDAAKLEEGPVTAFYPKSVSEVALSSGHRNNLYFTDEIPEMKIKAVNSSKDVKIVNVTIRVFDFWNRKVLEDAAAINIQPGDIAEKTMALHLPPGAFRIAATGDFPPAEMLLNLVPRPLQIDPDKSVFGNHVKFSEYFLDIAENIGVKWCRMYPPHITKWIVVEPEKGKYFWHDNSVQLALDHKMQLLGMLETTAAWASSGANIKEGLMAGRPSCFPAVNIKDWENYVRKVVGHYKNIKYWEVWNEPSTMTFFIPSTCDPKDSPREYVELLKAAYKAAKEANPDCIIVGGAGQTLPPIDWLAKIFEYGALDYCDIVSYHTYINDHVPVTENYVKEVRNAMKKYGKEKPLWNTEYGLLETATTYSNMEEISPGAQATAQETSDYIVKSFVVQMGEGIERIFYYSMSTPHLANLRLCATMIEWDRILRPSAVAYAVCANMIDGKKIERKFNPVPGVSAFQFKGDSGKVVVFWTASPKTKIKAAFNVDDKAKVIDIMGNNVPLERQGSQVSVEADFFPQYLVIK